MFQVFRAPFHAGCAILALSALLVSACGGKPARASIPASVSAPAVRVGYTESGVASWYGDPYHGRRTASGEIFDMQQLTAAHPTLPFQTEIEVTNLDNGKRVTVRITDRGPFVKGRILDLSRAAASAIDMLGPGTARVRLKVIRAPQPTG